MCDAEVLVMKIKKVLAVFCAVSVAAVCLTAMPAGRAAAAGASQTPAQTPAQPAVDLKSKSAIMVEESTGQVLYENNSHEKLYPASLTKIMTELLVLEAIESGKLHFTDKISCSEHAASMGGSDIWLERGEVMTVTDLFKAMVVNSANDAAVALGEKVAGSEPAFVNLMNEKAKQLGMNDTHFVNCTGLDAENNLTSAYDVMLMSKALIKHRQIFNYTSIWMDTLRGGKTALYNTNKLIRFYVGANGLKTGSTSKAGFCLSATAERDNMELIAVVMDCPTLNERFSSAEHLLDYGFANWSRVSPKMEGKNPSVKVLRGVSGSVAAVPDGAPSILTQKGKEKDIKQKVTCAESVTAPVVKNQVVGQITFSIDGKTVGTIPLKAACQVDRLTFPRAFARLFAEMVRL